MNKKLSILVSTFLCVALSSNVKSETLIESLQRYCVPTAEVCGTVARATYNTSESACECSACGMYYDKISRSCQTCPEGTYVNNRYSTECIRPDCGIGNYGVVETGKTDCGIGFYKVALSSCK